MVTRKGLVDEDTSFHGDLKDTVCLDAEIVFWLLVAKPHKMTDYS